METSSTTYKHCDVIKVSGRVDSSTAPSLAQAINAVNDQGRYKIVLDMEGVEYISSSGLWVLVNAQKTCKRYNRGEVVLASVSPKIQSALDLAGFIPFFKLFENVVAAVGNF